MHVENEQVQRAFWKLCKVVEQIVGPDGSFRSARVEVTSKEKGKTILTRSLKYLIPMEIRSQPPLHDSQLTDRAGAKAQPPVQASSQQAAKPHSRPRRKAAVIGEICRRDTS